MVEDSGSLQRELVKLHRRVADRLRATSYDAVELLTSAAQRSPTRRSPGPWCCTCRSGSPRRSWPSPGPWPCGAEFTVILGLTGVLRADAAVRDAVTAITGDPGPTPPKAPTAQLVRHHSDSDDEVRGVVHGVLDVLQQTPAHRIAVLHAAALPYARLLHEQLAAAGVQANGPGVAAVDERALPRGLLDILALPADLPRAEVFRALSHAPVRDPATGRRIPVGRWERVSRLAGVVGGTDWQRRLRRFADEQLAVIEDPERGGSDGRRRDAEAAFALSAFGTALGRRLTEGGGLASWPALAWWAVELFHDLYGGPADLAHLPSEERYAAAVLENVLPGLGPLGTLEERADRALFVEVLTEELRSARPRVGRFGEGVFVGPISAAVGLSVDVAFVLGLSEDAYPGRTHVEALLPERIRDTVAGLPGSRENLDRQQRDLLAAFMSAERVIASFARGDLRRNTLRLPSRFLLPTLRELGGDRRLAATRWATAESERIDGAPSYAATLGRSPRPATDQEWRVRSIATGGGRDPVTAAAVDLLSARAGTEFTRFDGNLGGGHRPARSAAARAVSPTALESYADCPHAYFVRAAAAGRAARAAGGDHRDQRRWTSAPSCTRRIDEFVPGARPVARPYGEPWTHAQRAALRTIAHDQGRRVRAPRAAPATRCCGQHERSSHPGRPGPMLDDDNRWRVEHGRPGGGQRAGVRHARRRPPVTLPLPSGRTVRMRGSADKVDQARRRRPAGHRHQDRQRSAGSTACENDPVGAGTKLQLPVYAYAARANGWASIRCVAAVLVRPQGPRRRIAVRV